MNPFISMLAKFLPVNVSDMPSKSSIAVSDNTGAAAPVNWRQPDSTPEAIKRDVEYAMKIGNEYVELLKAHDFNLRGASILELGPGHNFGAALVLASYGAFVIVADRFPVPWAEDYHGKFYSMLQQQMKAAYPEADTALIRRCVEESSTRGAIAVTGSAAEYLSGVADSTVDVILSNAVLEHVLQPERVAKELYRVTRPGGAGLHQIDFRDHRDFSRPLEYLLLENDVFEQMFAERNGECGRQTRHYEMLNLFRNAGFDVAEFDANWIAEDDYLDEFIPRLRESGSSYQAAPRDELRIISGRFILRKPN